MRKLKILHNKKSYRGDGERQSFAFFIIGAVVVLIAVFLVGIYFGRELEKGGGATSDNRLYMTVGEGRHPEWSVQGGGESGRIADNVRRELGSFSEEAVLIPVVPPTRAENVLPPVEPDNALTFQESLSKKYAEPLPLEKAKGKGSSGKKSDSDDRYDSGVMIQAGAFKERQKAETRLKKMENAGYPVRLARSGKGGKDGLFLVLAGPFPGKEAAMNAIQKLKTEMKIDAIVAKG